MFQIRMRSDSDTRYSPKGYRYPVSGSGFRNFNMTGPRIFVAHSYLRHKRPCAVHAAIKDKLMHTQGFSAQHLACIAEVLSPDNGCTSSAFPSLPTSVARARNVPVVSPCGSLHDLPYEYIYEARVLSRVTPICTTPHLHYYCTKKRIYNLSILRLHIVQHVEIKAIRPKLLFVVYLERRININITLLCLPRRYQGGFLLLCLDDLRDVNKGLI